MLIMIITKIIILCFIQIRHTDDFPSTGTRLVNVKPEMNSCEILTHVLVTSDVADNPGK